jgi:hypothetical protein
MILSIPSKASIAFVVDVVRQNLATIIRLIRCLMGFPILVPMVLTMPTPRCIRTGGFFVIPVSRSLVLGSTSAHDN